MFIYALIGGDNVHSTAILKNNLQDNINQFISYCAYKELINYLAFGSTTSAMFPPSTKNGADISEAKDDYYQYLKTLQQEYKEILEFCFDSKFYTDVLGEMTPAATLQQRRITKIKWQRTKPCQSIENITAAIPCELRSIKSSSLNSRNGNTQP